MRWLLPLTVLAVGCGGSEPTPSIEPKLSAIQEKILTPSCATAACHSTANAANSGQLDLSAGHSYDALVNVAAKNIGAIDDGLLRVKPGDAAKSFLLIKVKEPVPVAYGTRMPQAGDPLSDDARAAIEQWIAQGAKND